MMTGHQSFDLYQDEHGWKAQSHNYPDLCGEGVTKDDAVNDLGMKAVYYWDNNQAAAKAELKDRIKQGLQCRCGERLPGDAVAYHTGTQIRPLFGPKKVDHSPVAELKVTPRQGQGK